MTASQLVAMRDAIVSVATALGDGEGVRVEILDALWCYRLIDASDKWAIRDILYASSHDTR